MGTEHRKPPTGSDGSDLSSRRKKKYAEDPDHRRQVQTNSRNAWRDRNGFPFLRDCRENLPRLPEFGEVRDVTFANGGKSRALCFSLSELATVLGGQDPYQPQVIRRWIADGRLPAPEATASVVTGTFGREGGSSDLSVYTEPEVRAIILELGDHQQDMAYLRKGQDVIKRMHAAVEGVR